MIKTCGETFIIGGTGDLLYPGTGVRVESEANLFRHRTWELSQIEAVKLAISIGPRLTLLDFQFVHDAPRKRGSTAFWFGLLAESRGFVHLRILLWCVLLARGMRLIPQIRYQEFLSYSSLHRSLSQCSLPP